MHLRQPRRRRPRRHYDLRARPPSLATPDLAPRQAVGQEVLIDPIDANRRIEQFGRVGIGQDSRRAGFQISQRSDFFEVEVGLETTLKRPIINTRDEPHAVADLYRRLHVIIGDANHCDVANLLKLGTTSLVLAMIEDGFLPEPPSVHQPVKTLHAVSHDLTCTRPIELATGERVTFDLPMWIDVPQAGGGSAGFEGELGSIIRGGAYDNNLLCIAEKEVFVVASVFDRMMQAMERAGAVRLSASEVDKLTSLAITQVGEGDYRLVFHLAPPLLAKRDPQTGELQKSEYGGWVFAAFKILAKLRFLRGSALDIFGRPDDFKFRSSMTLFEAADPSAIVMGGNVIGQASTSPYTFPPSLGSPLYYQADDGAGLEQVREHEHVRVGADRLEDGEPHRHAVDLALVRRAIRDERKLRIAYRDAEEQQTSRLIWPFLLGFFDGARLISAWCQRA